MAGRLLAALGLIALAPAHALPQNGSVVSGNGNILVFDNGKQLSINQGSDKLAINWDRFDIAAGESAFQSARRPVHRAQPRVGQ